MLSLNQILEALNLKIFAHSPALEEQITGISIDTRTLQPGNLFIALSGENDGHHYVQDAIKNGALAVIVQDDYNTDDLKNNTYVKVPNTLEALKQIGVYARSLCQNAQIIAITGSVGKTTVKEYLNTLISPFGKTVSTQKSYNGSIGVPYSLAHLSDDTDFGIFEVGMNKRGEIAPLTQMVKPNIAIITSVHLAHTDGVGTLDHIAEEKSDILSTLQKGNTAILPFDAPHYAFLKNKAEQTGATIISVGKKKGADVQLIAFDVHDKGASIQAKIFDQNLSWEMPAYGTHYAISALFAVTAAVSAGITLEKIKENLQKLKPLPGRGNIETLTLKDGKTITIIDDSYNASIASMKAGLTVLSTIKGNRKIAVLGEMKELGAQSQQIHEELGIFVNCMKIDSIFSCGAEMKHFNNKLQNNQLKGYAETIQNLYAPLCQELQDGDVLFLKGSNGNQIWKIKEYLA
jgi:UDP-N-acetylmuramoyl-tripeptide--D-alanyl-D-alanine ligase